MAYSCCLLSTRKSYWMTYYSKNPSKNSHFIFVLSGWPSWLQADVRNCFIPRVISPFENVFGQLLEHHFGWFSAHDIINWVGFTAKAKQTLLRTLLPSRWGNNSDKKNLKGQSMAVQSVTSFLVIYKSTEWIYKSLTSQVRQMIVSNNRSCGRRHSNI